MTVKSSNIKTASDYSLDFLYILFTEYTSLWEMRKHPSSLHLPSFWMEVIDIVSNDMLVLVELNLSQDLVDMYRGYVENNNWNNSFAIRLSCKNIDKAVSFLRAHFGHIKNQRPVVKKKPKSHLTLIKTDR